MVNMQVASEISHMYRYFYPLHL